MPRYIDADALIEAIKNELWDWQSLDDITATCVLKQTITDIQNAPTADVVERKDLDEITEAHEQIGYDQGHQDGYVQAKIDMENADV